MKLFVMTIALTFVLSGSVLAGEVPSVGVNAPPPDEPSAPTAPGDIPTSGYEGQISQTALTLIQLALSGIV